MSNTVNHVSGEQHVNHKLTEEDVVMIRMEAAMGRSQGSIAAYYNVSKHTVYNIIHRKKWAHVE